MKRISARARMRRWALAAVGTGLLGMGTPALPQGTGKPGADHLLAEAEQAAREGVVEVSVVKLQQYLQSPESSLDPATKRRAELLLAEEFLNLRKANEALRILVDPDLPLPEAEFSRARAALRLQRWETAGQTYARLLKTATNPALQEHARLGLAAAKYGARDLEGALSALQPLLNAPAGTPERAILLAAQICLEQSRLPEAESWLDRLDSPGPHEDVLRRCLQGELALRQGRTEEARALFASVADAATGKTGRSMIIAEVGLSRIDLAEQNYEDAEERLEKIIADQPRTPLLAQLFSTLFEVYTLEGSTSDSDLSAWSREDPAAVGPERPAYASFYLGKLAQHQGAADRARELFNETVQRFGDQPAASLATMELARMALSTGQATEAIRSLEGGQPQKLGEVNKTAWYSLLAEAYARNNAFSQAHTAYGKALENADRPVRERVLYNMAVCALRVRNDQLFTSDREALLRCNPGPELLGELAFQEGRLEAAQADPRAEGTLRQFLSRFPNHPRVPEAHLILAERAYQVQPVNFKRVVEELPQDGPGDPALAEQQERLAFFAAADDPRTALTEAPRRAQAFFTRYPASPARAEIRLKLGEVYFHASDYANARTQFELVRDEQPESPLAEPALFLAGEAARRSLNPSSVDDAIALFEEVYKLGGPLRFQARLEQALAKRQVQQENEAITLLDDLLALNPPGDIRNQAIEAKGQAQFTLGAQDPSAYARAKTTFDTLTGPDSPVEWRQRGLYEAGKCLEKLNRMDEALATYYDALNLTGSAGDQIWFYRAGFDAAQILEQRRAWGSAGAIYEKLANTRGARAAEARERLTKLRLEHFLWPD